MALFDVLITLAISLGLGLLVGMQREYASAEIAGIRTFALISLFGTLSALLAEAFGGWIIGAGALALAAMMIVANLLRQRSGTIHAGMTTEVAGLVMFVVGAFLVAGRSVVADRGHIAVALAVGGTVALLLHLKEPMHRFVTRMGTSDLKAIMQFVLIALVILPVLPAKTYGPYQVLNPFEIWLVVVLIVGISLAGYVIYKLFGANAGVLAGGILGGIISSTATTVSYARLSAGNPQHNVLAGRAIMIASAVSLVRILALIAIVAPGSVAGLIGPIGVLAAVWLLIALAACLWGQSTAHDVPLQSNPAQLKAAIVFGLLYGVIKFAAAAAHQNFGLGGIYGVAAVSGLVDLDAITLSTAGMVQTPGALDATTGWRVILLAAMMNMVFKAGAVGALGNRQLFARIALLFGAAVAAGVLIFLLWPHP